MNTILSISNFEFRGKAASLEQLEPVLTRGKVLPIYRFSSQDWQTDRDKILEGIREKFGRKALIVRSSCRKEDQQGGSGAGAFLSIANVHGEQQLKSAIIDVISSYGELNPNDDVLVQEMATGVIACGVAMTTDPENGLPYTIVNYTLGSSTDGVTSGCSDVIEFVTLNRDSRAAPQILQGLFPLIKEVEVLTNTKNLDIEFAITDTDVLLFQVRPLIVETGSMDIEKITSTLRHQHNTIDSKIIKHRIAGSEHGAIFGQMPDWNPAEIIGVKPKPLAFSMYRELITKFNWSSARFRYGYRDLRGKDLMYCFAGSPYISIPRSVESFIPSPIPIDIVKKVVTSCCYELEIKPELHDKLEFAVIPTCFTTDLNSDKARYLPAFSGLTESEVALYISELKNLTESIIRTNGPFFTDMVQIERIENQFFKLSREDHDNYLQRFRKFFSSANVVAELFSGVARAAFIGTSILKSLEETEVVEKGFVDKFLSRTNSVGKKVSEDFNILSKDAFLASHGHIRPGTYDIEISRYDEAPDNYFDWEAPLSRFKSQESHIEHEVVNKIQSAFIRSDFNVTSKEFLHFAVAAVEAREKVKYLYGAFVSEALSSLSSWGEKHSITRTELSFLSITECPLDHDTIALSEINRNISLNMDIWSISKPLRTPSLICSANDIYNHQTSTVKPNFITNISIESKVFVIETSENQARDISGKIVLIENADPGFDWIFTHKIAGFITAYGGENSHMSIRAREFGVPAAIGVGESMFSKLKKANTLLLDCSCNQIQVIV